MKSVKPLLWSLVVLFLVVVVVQNIEFLQEKKALKLNLMVWTGETAPIYLSVYFLGFFLMGLLISGVSAVCDRFKARNEIKNHLETIRKLEEEIKVLKTLPAQQESTPSPGTETA